MLCLGVCLCVGGHRRHGVRNSASVNNNTQTLNHNSYRIEVNAPVFVFITAYPVYLSVCICMFVYHWYHW